MRGSVVRFCISYTRIHQNVTSVRNRLKHSVLFSKIKIIENSKWKNERKKKQNNKTEVFYGRINWIAFKSLCEENENATTRIRNK